MAEDYKISAPAMHAAQVLLQNFEFRERPGGRVPATQKNLATLIDVCTHAFRVEAAIDRMTREVMHMNKESLSDRMSQLREAVRAVSIVRNAMPAYQSEQPVRRPPLQEPVSPSRMEELSHLKDELGKASTPAEENKILQAAGLLGR